MMPPYARTRASIPWAFLRVYRLTASPRSVVPNGSGRGAPRAQAALPARIMDHPRTVDFIGCEADTLAPGAPPLGDRRIFRHEQAPAVRVGSRGGVPRRRSSPHPLSPSPFGRGGTQDVPPLRHGAGVRGRGPGAGHPAPRAPPARLPTVLVAEPERTLAIPVRCRGIRGGTRVVAA